MSKRSKKEYLQEIYGRYMKVEKEEKQKILDEFCKVCGYNRKYAIRILNQVPSLEIKSNKKRAGPKKKYHTEGIIKFIKTLWIRTNLICPERLKACIPIWIGWYKKEGKEHKKYEFGSKGSIITTKNSGIIIGAMNVKNEYDGHILPAIIKQCKKLRGIKLDKLMVDRGFKGVTKIGTTIIQRPEKAKKSDSQYEKQKKRKDFGRRAAIEPIISHLKTDFLLSRNYLKGAVGDSVNLTLSCAAFNFRKFIRKLEFIFAIFRMIIKWNFEVSNLKFKTF